MQKIRSHIRLRYEGLVALRDGRRIVLGGARAVAGMEPGFGPDDFIGRKSMQPGRQREDLPPGKGERGQCRKIGRAHVLTPVTSASRMPSSA